MFKSMVYQGNSLLGEVEIYPQDQKIDDIILNQEIRISHFSQPSERCPPLAVLHTIAPCGVSFKMESKLLSEDSLMFSLHCSCLRENKTAVVQLGEEELHLVAMSSRKNPSQSSCFWGFNVAQGLYNSSLVMLNLRCLGIVFDLDETLIVANTMRSFEDRIDALQRKISTEMDPQRVSGMLAEIKRYQDDKTILKQYVENDQVIENGKVIKVQAEVFPALSDNHQPIVRPLIRLHEKNIILTRINPVIRDTSVLVRLRPAWEDLRSYLTARGRKRFEVYVCTMAERDYALEMWRLLDPESNLINSNELLDRIVCVKAGSRKSLLNVFNDGICDPKMALVIDDRLKVWDEKDQPRVHVVPAFAPYYAPQAEANNVVPVLCVARNVACNVRGGFFKDFDEGLLQRILDVFYEDDVVDIPFPPDVSNYLISEVNHDGESQDDGTASNKCPLRFEGMSDVEVERRLKDAIPASFMVNNLDSRLPNLQHVVASSSSTLPQSSLQGTISFHDKQLTQPVSLVKPLSHVAPPEASLHSSPAREEGEVGESELDPDTRRRLLILQHGQDTRDNVPREPPVPVRPPLQVPIPPAQSRGSWFPSEEELSPRKRNNITPKAVTKEFPVESDAMHLDKHRPQHLPFFHGPESSVPSDKNFHENHRLRKEAHRGDDRMRLNHTLSRYHSFSGEEMPPGRSPSSNRDLHFESGRGTPQYPETPAGVLHDIAMKCGTKVEYRPALIASMELQFSVEVWFSGEKVGEGIGRTRKEAKRQAAECSLKNLANKYLSNFTSDPSTVHGNLNKLSHANENGFISEPNSFSRQPFQKEELLPISSTSEPFRFLDPRVEESNKSMGSVSALKDLCMKEGLALVFDAQPPVSSSSTNNGEVYAQMLERVASLKIILAQLEPLIQALAELIFMSSSYLEDSNRADLSVAIGTQVCGKGTGPTWEAAKMQAAEEALVSLKAKLGQGTYKRLGSPRSFPALPNKRMKQDFSRVLQRVPSAGRYSNNAHPVP